MSTMFSVSVQHVTLASVELRLDAVHPDAGPVTPSATMALMLVYEPIAKAAYIDDHPHLAEAPLGRAMDTTSWLDPAWLKKNARGFVARVTRKQNVLTVIPTDPAWIAHLRKGMAWDSAAYDAGPGHPAPARAPVDGDGAVASADPARGFKRGAPREMNDDWDRARLARAWIPKWGALRYVAPASLSEAAAMQRELPGLIGQPVLVVPRKGAAAVGTLVHVYDDGFFLYHETSTGCGGELFRFAEVKTVGRAHAKASAEVTKPSLPKGAKAAAAGAPSKAASKTGSKAGAKAAKEVERARAGASAPLEPAALQAALRAAGLRSNQFDVKELLKATVYASAGKAVLIVDMPRPKRTFVLTTSTHLFNDDGLPDADKDLLCGITAELAPKVLFVCTPQDDAAAQVTKTTHYTGDIPGLVQCRVTYSTTGIKMASLDRLLAALP